MPARVHTGFTTIALFVAATVMTYAAVTFTSTFKSLDAGAVSFAGKKVAALVMSNDDSLRIAGEESLVRELSARGMQAVATYRIAPKEELARPETARPWFERANIEGVVVIRPVSVDARQSVLSRDLGEHQLRHALELLRLRLGSGVRSRRSAEGNVGGRREHGLQPATQPTDVGRSQ